MKIKISASFFLFFFFLAACNFTPKSEKFDSPKAFDISTLPNNWVKLTQTDSDFIIYNSCDMGNTLLTIINHKDSNELLLHGTQEDYELIVLESFIGNNDTIILKAKWKHWEEYKDFKFCWVNKQLGLGRWITTYSSGFTSDLIFVTSNKQENYLKIDQPCKECWGDECDDIESQKLKQDSAINRK